MSHASKDTLNWVLAYVIGEQKPETDEERQIAEHSHSLYNLWVSEEGVSAFESFKSEMKAESSSDYRKALLIQQRIDEDRAITSSVNVVRLSDYRKEMNNG